MKHLFYVLFAILFISSLGMGQLVLHPKTISHQGYLADSAGVAINDTLPMTFRLYFNDSLAFTQSFPSVPVIKGVFTVELDVSSLAGSSLGFDWLYMLETEVNGEVLTPRTRLSASPYSLAPWGTNGSSVYFNSGNVGIGTMTPPSKLTVNGTVAASGINTGSESIKIVRGTVGPTGSILSGSGFSVTHDGTGIYTISFTQPFSDYPSVSVSVINFGFMQIGALNFGGPLTVWIRDPSTGTFFDSNFTFIVMGGSGSVASPATSSASSPALPPISAQK
ncbi:MAG TPA: hypothetical protein VL633_12085 [Bacteroidota bacterium]|jgi:hypothetical protein|nr:hypothetical protein [Bacteroidota bacterium]